MNISLWLLTFYLRIILVSVSFSEMKDGHNVIASVLTMLAFATSDLIAASAACRCQTLVPVTIATNSTDKRTRI